MFVACRIGMRQVVDQLSMGQETESQEQRSFAASSFAGVGGSSMSASAGGMAMGIRPLNHAYAPPNSFHRPSSSLLSQLS